MSQPTEKTKSWYRTKDPSFREEVTLNNFQWQQKYPKILLIDDDKVYGEVFKKFGKNIGFTVDHCDSVSKLFHFMQRDYDVIAMDYDLGFVTGIETTEYLEHFNKNDIPVILISRTERHIPETWPATVREFVRKDSGHVAVFDALLEAHQVKNLKNS